MHSKFSGHFSRRERRLGGAFASILSALVLSAAPTAFAEEAPAAKVQASPKPTAAEQAQIIVVRQAADAASKTRGEPASVYVDSAFHTALMPHTYARFCVPAGIHSIETPLGKDPKFESKTSMVVSLEGGRTYFLLVPENRSAVPTPLLFADAEKLLDGSGAQRRFVSRVKSVQRCADPVPAAAVDASVAPAGATK